jgi:ABC-2 type transport system permease protein
MQKLIASVKKEFLILSRDRAGLAVLYIMPVALIIVMVLIQENTFRAIHSINIPILLVNEDRGMLGHSIGEGLERLESFPVIREAAGRMITADSARMLVANGEYKIAVLIPAGGSETVNRAVQRRINGQTADSSQIKDTILLYFDPAINLHFKNVVKLALSWALQNTENQLALQQLLPSCPSGEIARFIQMALASLAQSAQPQNYITEKYGSGAENFLPNSVQHNVPAWSMFAMFFIVIPLAGSIIREREEGSFQRLMTLPVSAAELFAGKLLIYMLVCVSQFVILAGIGLYILPLLGFPRLVMGGNIAALILVVLASAGAAIAYGTAVGMFASTHQQASSFGAISVIIAAAVGGIWVPVFIMPPVMQHLSKVSPLNWGLNAFHDLFLRNAGMADVLPPAMLLIIFAVFTMSLALFKFAGSKK